MGAELAVCAVRWAERGGGFYAAWSTCVQVSGGCRPVCWGRAASGRVFWALPAGRAAAPVSRGPVAEPPTEVRPETYRGVWPDVLDQADRYCASAWARGRRRWGRAAAGHRDGDFSLTGRLAAATATFVGRPGPGTTADEDGQTRWCPQRSRIRNLALSPWRGSYRWPPRM